MFKCKECLGEVCYCASDRREKEAIRIFEEHMEVTFDEDDSYHSGFVAGIEYMLKQKEVGEN